MTSDGLPHQVLSELLTTRHTLAAALGRRSFAHHALSHDRMESCPNQVS